MSNYKEKNFKVVYRQLFNILDNLPEGIKIRKKEFNMEKYINFKRELVENNLDMSHVEFISCLFKIKQNI